MHFTANQKGLHSALQTVTRAVSGRSTLPILNNIHVSAAGDTVTLAATDLEIGIKCSFPATVTDGGQMTVPAKTISEIVSQLGSGDVSLQSDDRNTAVLKSGRSKYNILGLPAEEYPPFPEVSAEVSFTIPQGELARMSCSVAVSCSTDDTRPLLTGIETRLSGSRLTMAATDTHRLSVRWCEVTDPVGERAVIIPDRALAEVSRSLEAGSTLPVKVRFDGNQVSFDLTSIQIVSRLIAGQFPKFARVLPKEHTTRLLAPIGDLQQAVRRAMIVAKEGGNKLVLRGEGPSLTIMAQAGNLGNAEEQLEVTSEGDDLQWAINGRFVADVLGVLEGDTVVIEATKPLAPVALRPLEDDRYLAVVMPLQEQ